MPCDLCKLYRQRWDSSLQIAAGRAGGAPEPASGFGKEAAAPLGQFASLAAPDRNETVSGRMDPRQWRVVIFGHGQPLVKPSLGTQQLAPDDRDWRSSSAALERVRPDARAIETRGRRFVVNGMGRRDVTSH